MSWSIGFFINSILLGVGLAMDAFSVSMVNGFNEPEMRRRRMVLIAGTFGFFQFLMPMVGWICVHTIVEKFTAFKKFIPWIALILLLYIGGKMLIEGIRSHGGDEKGTPVTFGALMVQGVATAIDALSVGFTISGYGWFMAFICALIIAVVTYIISTGGLMIGRKIGTRLSGKASILGGVILIAIGIEIFVTGVF